MKSSEDGTSEIPCTWDEDANCMNCSIKGELDCKWKQHLLLRFYKYSLPAIISGFLGLMIVGLKVSWIPLITYGAFWIFFFGFFEIRVLCSHCPYYAEGEGRVLHCLANHGMIKIWKYRPGPMKAWEQLGFASGALFFVLFPIVGEIYGLISLWEATGSINGAMVVLILLLLASTIGGIIFAVKISTRICIKCVNFSCPFNRVPKKMVDEYLKINPVMKEAWEKADYKIN
ncbi:MAG: hypothetical protein ACFFGZ_00905 [Candidatus Thorarchaeota archaeon]